MSDLMTQAMTRILQEITHCPQPLPEQPLRVTDTVITGWWMQEVGITVEERTTVQ